MNQSTLFSSMGLGNLDIGYIILVLLILFLISIILLVMQIVKSNRLKKRLDKFMTGKAAGHLEEKIISLCEDNKLLKKNIDSNESDIRTLFSRLQSAFQKMGLIRYDAFNYMGGQLSFCVALLNERNDGFIINSVHSTEGCYSYTKEIKNGECSIMLGKEEKEVLDIAMGK